MITVNIPATVINPSALDSAIRAILPNKFFGLSTGNSSGFNMFYYDDSVLPADLTAALALINAHDPVFMSVDTLTIPADNTTIATVTIVVTNQNPAPVTLTVNGTDLPVTISNGVGTIQLKSVSPMLIFVNVKNGSNRNTDLFRLQAI